MTETWEYTPHTFDDDGFEAKCFGGQTTVEISSVELIDHGHGTAECPECMRIVPVINING